MSAAQIVRDFQTVADATYLATKSRIDSGEQGLEMPLAVALGMAHQARQILEALVRRGEAAPGVVEGIKRAIAIAEGVEETAQKLSVSTRFSFDDRGIWRGLIEDAANIQKALALARQHGVREPWQQIKNAPSELPIDIWYAPPGKVPCRVPSAHSDDSGRWYDSRGVRIWHPEYVTHWMPLPAAPATDVGEK
jgi:hypothetical protein